MRPNKNILIISLLTISLSCSSAPKLEASSEIPSTVAAPEYDISQQCDKTLNSCDLTLHKKNDQLNKQKELLDRQAKQLADAKVKSDSPFTNPIVWAAVGTGAVAIAGPIAIPFVVVGAVLVGVFLK